MLYVNVWYVSFIVLIKKCAKIFIGMIFIIEREEVSQSNFIKRKEF